MRLDSLSKNIVTILTELAKNEGLAKLLLNDVSTPFSSRLPPIDSNKILNQKSELCRIFPFPFSPEAHTEDHSFIRVYYPNGSFNENEVIAETQINFDIVVAKSLWLIEDGNRKLIRPYEIMSRVTDMLGKRSIGSTIQLKFSGWNHLSVNNRFDALRLYSEYMSVEAGSHGV
ncbi:hypothetical protein [Thermoactinomyces sp. DSM 45892]|uniref:hypothetical protein n=1 Tax=Thermoactinomyces sp. DSM 45892 TaxID=1882753 RepID=UPI00089D9FBA|nr:hypothetical protein [Thermoactinomyces sp. DSM 45892]SDX95594.1 hypothetical protein SAMN05444416_10197 [Thermoactinomyces sp. DSM 45892]